jgi:hypothetical protein
MKVQFEASLQGAACLKFDDDGSSSIKLTVDGSQLPEAVKMLTFQGKVFRVTVEAVK